MIRVIDESAEDYLYPKGLFLPVNPPEVDSGITDAQLRSDVEWGLGGDD